MTHENKYQNKYFYPEGKSMPRFIVMLAHDGEGNLHEIKYIHEDAVKDLLLSVEGKVADITTNYKLIGGDTE